jgi:hypothetical protein
MPVSVGPGATRSIFLSQSIEHASVRENVGITRTRHDDYVNSVAVDRVTGTTWHPGHLSDVGRLSARYDEIGDLDLHRLIILV